jgi:hypothetical protein
MEDPVGWNAVMGRYRATLDGHFAYTVADAARTTAA